MSMVDGKYQNTCNREDMMRRTGAEGVSDAYVALLNDFKRRHFDMLSDLCTYDELLAAQKALFDHVRTLEREVVALGMKNRLLEKELYGG